MRNKGNFVGKILGALAGIAVSALAAPAFGAVTTLDFSGNICGLAGGDACSNYGVVGQSYGDSAEADVSYRSVVKQTGVVFQNHLQFWNAGYGNLAGVVWGGNGATFSEIAITPTAGYEVSLLSFDFATYLGRFASVPLQVFSGGGVMLLDATLPTDYPTHNSLTLNTAYFGDGIILRWGPNGYDVGLDNLRFDVRAVEATAVPEPASWALMIAGFGLAGAAIRSRRKTATPSIA